jgi:DNA end-binding protein Ku
VANTEIVKGYEFEKGQYVVMTEEDLAKVRPESTRVIDLVQFADDRAIDPMYVERSYYLAPDGPVAASSFAVMREGMQGKAGIGKLALYGREYLIAVKPHGPGLVMYTLHHAAEIRRMDAIDELRDLPATIKPQEAQLAKQVIESFGGELNLAEFTDEYQTQLRAIIDAKIAGREVVVREAEAPQKVVNLMEALRKSLDAVSATKKKTAKVELPRKPAARAEGKKRAAR